MKKKRLGTGKIAFLAREAAIREKIEAGYTVAMLHDEYKNEIEIEYGQFLNYVNRYIRSKPDESKGAKPATPVARAVRTREPGQPAFVSSDTPRDNLVKPKE